MPPLRIGMPIDLHIVRRIEKRGIDRRVVTNYSAQEVDTASVTAADAVIAQEPDIAKPAS